MKKVMLLFALISMVIFMASCIEENGKTRPDGVDEQIDTVSFSDDIQPIFQMHCISCHGDFYPDGNYDLTTYDATMTSGDHAPCVVPGQPDSSWLVFVISPEDTTAHDRSPYDNDEVVAPIREWIRQGALDN